MEYNWHTFPNVGYITAKLTEEQLRPIRNEVNVMYQKNFSNGIAFNHELAGHINNEYILTECKDYTNSLLLPYVQAHENEFQYVSTINSVRTENDYRLELASLWVNFQKPTEYNPLHEHGGLYSFVIWLNIPYDLEEEKQKFSKAKDKANQASTFNFAYTNSLGKVCVHNIPVDKSYENTVCIFPSNLNHYVNPFFTTDEYRISVSGNFKLVYN
jgi:hypothetical protein